jgi:hypothetical protein
MTTYVEHFLHHAGLLVPLLAEIYEAGMILFI